MRWPSTPLAASTNPLDAEALGTPELLIEAWQPKVEVPAVQ